MPGIEGVEREDLHDGEVRGVIREVPDSEGQPDCPVATAVRGALRGVGD